MSEKLLLFFSPFWTTFFLQPNIYPNLSLIESMKNKKIKKQKNLKRFDFFEREPELLFCENCGVPSKDAKVIFSRKFKCKICTTCYDERLNENTGDVIDPKWWQ